MSYDKLVAALRCCEFGWSARTCDNCEYSKTDCPILLSDAADAIEALQAEQKKTVTQIFGEEQQKWTEYCTALGNRIKELEQQMPKQGEWVEENRRPRSSQFVCSECHRTAYDPQPTRDKAWRKRCRYSFCPNCGAKMEVQDGDT